MCFLKTNLTPCKPYVTGRRAYVDWKLWHHIWILASNRYGWIRSISEAVQKQIPQIMISTLWHYSYLLRIWMEFDRVHELECVRVCGGDGWIRICGICFVGVNFIFLDKCFCLFERHRDFPPRMNKGSHLILFYLNLTTSLDKLHRPWCVL